jgi:DNA invertase Pin-like site-specific DNA recombinase
MGFAVVGYCRVSSDGQADGTSLDTQAEAIRELR